MRQEILRTALKWVSHGEIDSYMSRHRYDDTIHELKTYFDSVIDWVSSIFEDTDKSMRGLEWGELYEKYHRQAYDSKEISQKVQELLADEAVSDRKGIYEYVLGGCQNTRLLNIRLFGDQTKKRVYLKQTEEAKIKGVSNCPLCVLADGADKGRIWKQTEMDADHVSAWSKGGATDEENCQMLCKTHNRVKGNR
jgi:hypothetical protein